MHQDDTPETPHGESGFGPLVSQFHDRRQGSPMPVLLEMVKQIHESQKAMDKKLTEHLTQETDALALAVKKLLQDSFPEGDAAGHKRSHEAQIEAAAERAKFWHEMRLAAAKWAGLGVLAFIAGAVWIAIKTEVHK